MRRRTLNSGELSYRPATARQQLRFDIDRSSPAPYDSAVFQFRKTKVTGTRRVWRFLAIAGGVLLLLGIAALLAAWWATQQEDEWYQQAIAPAAPEVEQEKAAAADEFERQALDLRNEARDSGAWEAKFSDAQINGWLAYDLKEKFPKALPSTVADPRVKFEPDEAKVACRLKIDSVDSVVVVGIDLYLTETPNQLAVRFRNARAGLLPLPMKRVTDTVRKAAEKGKVMIDWQQIDGDPVALVEIPEHFEQIEGRLIVEKVEVREGEIVLGGRTVREDGSGGSTDVQHIIVSQLWEKDKAQN
jgi:hypothetical protein